MGSTTTTERGRDTSARPVPMAIRQSRARLGDVRLWAGVGLLTASALLGAMLLRGDETVTVWRATQDLAAGAEVTGLEAVQVGPTVGQAGYARPGDPLSGQLRWPVAAGELVPLAALASATDADTRQVTVPVDPLHAPVGLQAGDVVEAWMTPRSDVGTVAAAEPVQVLGTTVVAAVTEEALGIGGELGVVLEVPAAQVAAVVDATRSGVLDLVAVPAGSQEPRL